MKKAVLITFILAFCAAGRLWAHPASSIKAEYDKDTNILTVDIAHNVKKPEKHHLEYITVTLGEDLLLDQNFKFQYSKSGLLLKYKIEEIKEGDEITVGTKCNFAKKQTKKIKIKMSKEGMKADK